MTNVERGKARERAFGYVPFEFDARGVCQLEAKVLDSVVLTLDTWKKHSTDHKGEDRTYFAEFQDNREAIAETLRNPESVRRIEDQFGQNYCFERISRFTCRTPGGSVVSRFLPLRVIVNGQNSMIRTFYFTKKIQTRGEVVYP